MDKTKLKLMVLVTYLWCDALATNIQSSDYHSFQYNNHNVLWLQHQGSAPQYHFEHHVHQDFPQRNAVRYHFYYPQQSSRQVYYYNNAFENNKQFQHVYNHQVNEQNLPNNFIKYRVIYNPEQYYQQSESQSKPNVFYYHYVYPQHRDGYQNTLPASNKNENKQENDHTVSTTVKIEDKQQENNGQSTTETSVIINDIDFQTEVLNNQNNGNNFGNNNKCKTDATNGKCLEGEDENKESTNKPPSADLEVSALDKQPLMNDNAAAKQKTRPILSPTLLRFGGQ